MSCFRHLTSLLVFSRSILLCTASYTPIVVKNVTLLGPQVTPDVSDVSRDGGHSVLISGNVVWLYDDTECFDVQGSQLSFVSNTAAISASPKDNVTTVRDFGVRSLGKQKDGSPKNAILAGTTVGTGGWVPFQPDELEFNQQMNGRERVAIWPGTPPTPISTEQAFLYAPLVYVDYKPQDPSKEYQGRGMTLISITAPPSGPLATRQGTQIGFGGFTTLVGRKSKDEASPSTDGDRDLYLLGVTHAGLQLARVGINDIASFSDFSFWDPKTRKFTGSPPKPGLIDNSQLYMPGTFSSGSVFFSPYYRTFLMVYMNKKGDSTFYIRYLDLFNPLEDDKTWKAGGKNGKVIEAEDAEALLYYPWSSEQELYASPTGNGGYNYAGSPHSEFFNRQYFAKSLYPAQAADKDRRNDWLGSKFVTEKAANGQDGKYLLLSWTSQKHAGMKDGIYEVQLAVVAFDDIPVDPDRPADSDAAKTAESGEASKSSGGDARVHGTETAPTNKHDAIGFLFRKMSGGGSHTMGPAEIGLLVKVALAACLFFQRMW